LIPEFGNDGLLPPGRHIAAWAEICNRYGYNPWRRRLLEGMKAALDVIKKVGCETAFLDGSFVTSKEIPGDFDIAWEATGADLDLLQELDPDLLNVGKNPVQKVKYYGELFPIVRVQGVPIYDWAEFFQIDKETKNQKGIVVIDVRSLP
jgi:hypothetical protein